MTPQMISLESARQIAEAAQARADALADGWEAAQEALEPIARASGFSTDAAALVTALRAKMPDLRATYRAAQAEADRLAIIANRLACHEYDANEPYPGTVEPDAIGDGLTPEEWDAYEREQDRLQREHDRAMDEQYA